MIPLLYRKISILWKNHVHLWNTIADMYKRQISIRLLELKKKYPVVTLTGARQAGKTTLIRSLFEDHLYFTLENPAIREVALQDPVKFLSQNKYRLILDEVQNAPPLFSYIQGIVDENREASFILSGSQNFLLNESISQSLAGRVAILNLHPLTWTELDQSGLSPRDYEELIWRGTYPGMYDRNIQPADFYPFYINSYLERDVRTLRNPSDLGDFQRFMKILAGRAGQLLNYADLSRDVGISPKTAKAWVHVLEQSHLIFLLQPYYKNFNKRLVKSPKLYFIDSGLLCYLLNIHAHEQLLTHFAQGAIFENAVVAEWYKTKYHLGLAYELYFWRDNHGKEIDLLIVNGSQIIPVEIKSAKTIRNDFMKSVHWIEHLAGIKEFGFVIYGGSDKLDMEKYRFIPWTELKKEESFSQLAATSIGG